MKLNGTMIIPTGIGCKLGGDAAFNPGVKLIAQCCDRLVINPNAVNASDINEMPTNCLYVEGSIIDRFLEGKIYLQEVKTQNRILMAVNSPTVPSNINSMNAGIWGIGAKIEILELNTPLTMKASLNPDGTAGGEVGGWRELIDQVKPLDFDALAIHTVIDCPKEIAEHYWNHGGTNPWGAVEAIASKFIADGTNKPVAHAPVDSGVLPNLAKTLIVKQSMAPEVLSITYMFCVLKGLHRAPRVDTLRKSENLKYTDMDFLLTPMNCWGPPHSSCFKNQIPIIVVRENTTCFTKFRYPKEILNHPNVLFVENYLEAAGVIMSWNAGVDPQVTTEHSLY